MLRSELGSPGAWIISSRELLWYHWLSMEALELKIMVADHPTLDQSIRESLMAGEAFRPLPHSLQRQLLGQVASGNWLTAQVQDTAVLITEDWVVSIHGKKLIDSVSAMTVLLNSIGQESGVPVTVDLINQNVSDEPLHRALERESRKQRVLGVIKWGLTIIVSAAAGALLQMLL